MLRSGFQNSPPLPNLGRDKYRSAFRVLAWSSALDPAFAAGAETLAEPETIPGGPLVLSVSTRSSTGLERMTTNHEVGSSSLSGWTIINNFPLPGWGETLRMS